MSVSVTATSSPRKPFFLFSVFPRSRHRIASFEFWSHYIWQPPIVSYSSHCRWNENCREEGEEVCHDSRTRLLVWLGWCLLLSTHCFPTWDEEQEGAGGGEKFLCHQKPENSPICTAVHVYIYSLLLSLCLSLSLYSRLRGGGSESSSSSSTPLSSMALLRRELQQTLLFLVHLQRKFQFRLRFTFPPSSP